MPNIPIKELHDDSDELFYPLTKANAVYTEDGSTIEQRLAHLDNVMGDLEALLAEV